MTILRQSFKTSGWALHVADGVWHFLLVVVQWRLWSLLQWYLWQQPFSIYCGRPHTFGKFDGPTLSVIMGGVPVELYGWHPY